MKPVERIWPGETVVCIASGPSLTAEDVNYVRGKARVIVINTSYVLAPWADVIYAADAKVWRWYWAKPPRAFPDAPAMGALPGMKFSLTNGSAVYKGVTVLRRGVDEGLSLNPNVLNTGRNSGYQAINLAVLLGAARIILLGYDMARDGRQEHWHPDHPNGSRANYDSYRSFFHSLVDPLREAGVSVVNCSRRTALHCFPKASLYEELPMMQEAVA